MTIEPNANLFNKGIDTGEKVQNVPLTALHGFPNHPFKVNIDDDLQAMADDIREKGVDQPIIARKREDGGYEIISGHRRRKACEIAGIAEIPTIVKNLTDDEAIIIMCSTNFHQRKTLLPSEKAFAYKMQLEAMKRQGQRTDLTSTQSVEKLSVEQLAEIVGEGREPIRRYIRLTELIPPILDLVDKGELNVIPAVYISFLDKDIEQPDILRAIESGFVPNVAQAKMLKEVSVNEGLTPEKMFEILRSEDRIHEHFRIPTGSVKKYFPAEYTDKQISKKIVEIVAEWAKNQMRSKGDAHER